MNTDLPEPFDRITRLVGRRSHPIDWPRSYDSFDAYDSDEFLGTFHYKAVSQLLDGHTFAHTVRVEFEGDELPFVVTPATSLDLSIRLDFGGGHYVENPDELRSKAELMQILQAALTTP